MCNFSEARSIGTSTDEITSKEVLRRNVPNVPTPMHDAHLMSNGLTAKDGSRVTDLIIELRDSCQNRVHFTPCPRNTKCKCNNI